MTSDDMRCLLTGPCSVCVQRVDWKSVPGRTLFVIPWSIQGVGISLCWLLSSCSSGNRSSYLLPSPSLTIVPVLLLYSSFRGFTFSFSFSHPLLPRDIPHGHPALESTCTMDLIPSISTPPWPCAVILLDVPVWE